MGGVYTVWMQKINTNNFYLTQNLVVLLINALVPEIFFGEYFHENLGGSWYWLNNKVPKTGKRYLNVKTTFWAKNAT